MNRPQSHEVADYYLPYIAYVPNDFMSYLNSSLDDMVKYIESVKEDQLISAYAEGKWTIAEVLVHIMDAERVFTYRALRIGRGDKTPLMGFEQDDYIPTSRANERTKSSLIQEFKAIRTATISLYEQFDATDMNRLGMTSGFPVSVRALGFIIGGHAAHHLKVLNEKY